MFGVSSSSRSLTLQVPPSGDGDDLFSLLPIRAVTSAGWPNARLLRVRAGPSLTALPLFVVLLGDKFSSSLPLAFLTFPVSLRCAVGGSIVSLHGEG